MGASGAEAGAKPQQSGGGQACGPGLVQHGVPEWVGPSREPGGFEAAAGPWLHPPEL